MVTALAQELTERQRAYIEDAIYLLDSGDGWASICARLGGTPTSIGRRLRRYGRTDLGGWFESLDRPLSERGDDVVTCERCGHAVARHNSRGRCRSATSGCLCDGRAR